MAHHAMVWVVADFSQCMPHTQTSPCVNYSGESDTGTVLSPSTLVLPVSIISPMLHTHSIIHYQWYIISVAATIIKKHPSYSFIHAFNYYWCYRIVATNLIIKQYALIFQCIRYICSRNILSTMSMSEATEGFHSQNLPSTIWVHCTVEKVCY